MSLKVMSVLIVCGAISFTTASDVLGCGGFIKSHVPIDFSKVMVKLYTKQGILKDETNCAPNNGYYFIPIYDKGEYNLQLEPPLGWTFDPTKVNLLIDGNTDLCSQGKDINFVFKGFGIAGKVESVGSDVGPADVTVELKTAKSDIRTTTTTSGGLFFFALVYPGDYVITISHPRWKILKNTINLKVSEGDTQLPQKSLIIGGFDVNGVIKSDSTQLSGVNVILYTDNKNTDNILVDNCVKTPLGPVTTAKYLCHVTADSSGKFKFPAVSTGRYTVLPHYNGKKVYFRPESQEFTVTDDSIKLETAFEIVGFSISGKVFDSVQGNPLRNAQVSLNGELVATTDGAGSYTLDKIKTGNYEILVAFDNVRFSPLTLSLTPSTVSIPDVAPSTYRVCGTVASDVAQTVGITKVGSTNHYTVTSEPGGSGGVFCEYLPPASYHVEVTGTKQGVQFYPRVQKIEVTSRPISDISFTQLKATLDGKVECITRKDCSDIKVILKSMDDPNDQDVIESIKDSGSYTFTEIRPGNYHVTLTSNRLCWNYPQFVPITVTSFQYTVPTIKQTGYTVYFQTSHDTTVTYKPPTTKTVDGEVTGTTLAITRTTSASPDGNTVCLPLSGTYTFHVDTTSCHTFDRNTLTYNTDSTANLLTVTAVRHRVHALIGAGGDYGLVRVVSTSGVAKEGIASQVKYDAKLGGYQLIYDLAAGESVTVKAESESLCFTPSEGVRLEGGEDCKDLATVIVSRRGHVFIGRILPPLAGVTVQLMTTADRSVRFTVATDQGGSYRFPPVEESDAVTCHVHAELDSYVFGGPDERGDFHVHKLAEVLVQVVDIVDNLPLQGALLSMSGGDSYRRNLQTNDDGKVSFQSLSPSDYFLRPMMKEYSFEPSSKMIPVKEGVTVNVRLMGRRVAYSAFGRVTSLNGEPEGNVIVIASGVAGGNCSQLSEETSTEASGVFRIRGLVPYCTYELRVHTAGDDVTIERSVPEIITAKILTEDISHLHLVTLHSSPSTDLLLRLYIPPDSPTAPPPTQPLTVRVSRMATSTPPTTTTTTTTSSGGASTILHSTRVVPDGGALTQAMGAPPFLPAPGMLVHLPSVPQDGKLYKVELESSVSLGGQTVNYFTANSSFKYVEMELVVVERTGDQQVKVTSVFTLVFIVVCMVAAYNIDRVTDFAREHLDGVLSAGKRATDRVTSAATSSGGGGGSQQKSSVNEYAIDTSEIDQIVQSINATKAPRKVKPKRI